MFALFPEFGARTRLGNRAEISHMNPKAKPSQPGQPGLYEEALSVRLKHGKGISYISVWIC